MWSLNSGNKAPGGSVKDGTWEPGAFHRFVTGKVVMDNLVRRKQVRCHIFITELVLGAL